jgi:thiamine biosynthesis lipoprotein
LGVSVVAPTATLGDGLSTAMLLVSPEDRLAVLRAAGGLTALYVTPDGVLARVDA